MPRNNNAKTEIFLIVMIAICMLTLIHVSNTKMNEVLSTNNSIILRTNPDKHIDGLLAKEMLQYKEEACTMMETYDNNFNITGRLPFDDDANKIHHLPDLKDYDGLKVLLKKYPEGHTRIRIGDNEEDIYFRWTKTTNSEERLVLIYIARPIVKNLWMIQFLCYLILILIFILVVRLRVSCQNDRINYYQKTSARIQNLFK